MNRGTGLLVRALAGALGCVSVLVPLAAETPTRAVLIRAPKPYDAIVAAIENAGGRVTHRYQFVDGLAAELPDEALALVEALVGAGNIGRDENLSLLETHDPRSGAILTAHADADDVVPLDEVAALGTGEDAEQRPLDATNDPDQTAADLEAQDYMFDREMNGLSSLALKDFTGEGVVIAIVDSGFRPMFEHVAPARIIAPGFNFVPDANEPPAISNANVPHGTQVAGLAAANRGFCFSPTNRFIVVAQHQDYKAAFPGTGPLGNGCVSPARFVPMIGSAPAARILPMKIFPRTGLTAPASRTIQAIEKAINLRLEYDAGHPTGINIKVLNLSVGGPTNAAARTLSDAAVEQLLAHDIVPVIAAGNDGFSSVTINSPATSFAALTVGAASSWKHEHIYRAQFDSPCATLPLGLVFDCAVAYRPDKKTHVAEFSSRGPTHDGRIDPDVVVNGAFAFTQGAGTGLTTVNWVSGTSFASPSVAGIAAVLRQKFPDATARQIRNAIIMSADSATIATATPNDQGAGLVNADAAASLLQAKTVPDTVATTALFTRSVPANMARAGRIVYKDVASVAFSNIRPAEIADVPFLVPPKTGTLYVRIHSIVPSLPLAQQNQFFGDDVFLRIQSAAVHRRDRRVDNGFLAAGTDITYTFDNAEPGVWRITPSGDWTNAGSISFSVEVWTTGAASPQHTVRADILDAAQHVYRVAVPPATGTLDVRLEWVNMEARYPFSDLDVSLTPPVGADVNACKTSRAPERCTVPNPAAGIWTVKVVALTVPKFGLPGDAETYTLRLAADGVVLPLQR